MHMFKIAATAALVLAAPAAHSLTTVTTSSASVTDEVIDFGFVITGWDDGGTVTGSFSGIDTDGDGQLSSFAGEISGFIASYSGGTSIPNILWTTETLFGLVYDLDGGPLGDGPMGAIEGIGADTGSAYFAIGPGPVGLCDIGEVCGVITVPGIPEPATWAMLIAGFGLVGATLRRRTAATV